MSCVYVIGSLRNPRIPEIAGAIRAAGLDAFDDWFAAGPEADDCWRDYERGRGHSYTEALKGFAARHVFEFDRTHLERAAAGLLVLPAGKSAHLELGWILGRGKPGFILLDEQHQEANFRYDCMYQFADGVFDNLDDAIDAMKETM